MSSKILEYPSLVLWGIPHLNHLYPWQPHSQSKQNYHEVSSTDTSKLRSVYRTTASKEHWKAVYQQIPRGNSGIRLTWHLYNFSIIRCDRVRGTIGEGLQFQQSTYPNSIFGPANRTTSHISHGTSTKNLWQRIPPAISCPLVRRSSSTDVILELNFGIIMGYFIAHYPLWHTELNADSRGPER